MAILLTTYPLWYAYLSGQSVSGQYLCAPLIPCQTPATGVESCTSVCTVNIENATFIPGTIKVAEGATIVWTNDDGFSHTVTPFNSTAWGSRILAPGESFTLTVGRNLTVGVYYYDCNIHPSMIGEVMVLPQ
ncbi:MAG: cupredoxin domain-containing protein [Thaumarchaeota archaeon]|nr:cupredoxin domain-containing protein [Nitrososphaerota archaeon]